MRQFSQFACVDWSGARAERPQGIAVATIGKQGPPMLIAPKPRWSRDDVKRWLLGLAADETDILIGFDLSMGLPFFDQTSYFPKWSASPVDAKSLWALVDQVCLSDPFLGVSSFLSHREAVRHFRHSKEHCGDLFCGGIGRLRIVEQYQRRTGQGNSASCFNLVGAAQVGKSSLTGMRMLHQLGGIIPIWPFDPLPEKGPVVVEIYTSIAARAAGLPKGRSKVRDRQGLKSALHALQVPCPARLSQYNDHRTDALITAAWMKQAGSQRGLWDPPMMTGDIARKEGWTFGVV